MTTPWFSRCIVEAVLSAIDGERSIVGRSARAGVLIAATTLMRAGGVFVVPCRPGSPPAAVVTSAGAPR